VNRCLLRKLVFFFGDAIDENEEVLFDGNYKWLRQIRERRFFLPNMERIFPLLYKQSKSLNRYIDWYLVKVQSAVAIKRISNRAAFPVGHSREILELLSYSMKQEFPIGEPPLSKLRPSSAGS